MDLEFCTRYTVQFSSFGVINQLEKSGKWVTQWITKTTSMTHIKYSSHLLYKKTRSVVMWYEQYQTTHTTLKSKLHSIPVQVFACHKSQDLSKVMDSEMLYAFFWNLVLKFLCLKLDSFLYKMVAFVPTAIPLIKLNMVMIILWNF